MPPPSALFVRSTSRWTAASSVTSVGSTSVRRPSFSTSRASVSSGPRSRAANATCAPSRASARQISAPMPLAAPVTMATRPSRLPLIERDRYRRRAAIQRSIFASSTLSGMPPSSSTAS